jgi:hypothetical protein
MLPLLMIAALPVYPVRIAEKGMVQWIEGCNFQNLCVLKFGVK